jgi:HEAT repeat protein
MKTAAIALTLLLFCSPTRADDMEGKADKLLDRIRRQPFHRELLCEKLVELGEKAIPAITSAAKKYDESVGRAASCSIAAMKWRINVRCFYSEGSHLDRIMRFSRFEVSAEMKKKIDEFRDAGKLGSLVGIMNAHDPATALAAMEAIEKMGKEAEAADSLLDSVSTRVWPYAGALLARAPKKVLEVILNKLRSRAESDRLAALTALSIAPPEAALSTLLKALENKSAHVRGKAAVALGVLGDKRAVEPLVKVLKEDKDHKVRGQAAWALGIVKDARKAAEALASALKNSKVCSRAIESLAVIGGKAAIEGLASFAKDGQQDMYERKSALRAIGQIGGEEALQALKPVFGKREEPYSVLSSVLAALGKNALDFLKTALEEMDKDDVDVVRQCQLALSAMRAEAVPLLLDLLESEKVRVRLLGRTLLRALVKEKKDFEYDRAKWEEYFKKNPPE